jgi:hypothetical protein
VLCWVRPFPLGDLEIGKFIEEMELMEKVKIFFTCRHWNGSILKEKILIN